MVKRVQNLISEGFDLTTNRTRYQWEYSGEEINGAFSLSVEMVEIEHRYKRIYNNRVLLLSQLSFRALGGDKWY